MRDGLAIAIVALLAGLARRPRRRSLSRQADQAGRAAGRRLADHGAGARGDAAAVGAARAAGRHRAGRAPAPDRVKAAAARRRTATTCSCTGRTSPTCTMLYPDLGFDPIKAFVPVAHAHGVFARAGDLAAACRRRRCKEFVAYAKANPGKLNFGVGLGTMPQIIGEYFIKVAGLDIVTIPYARRRAGARRYPGRPHPHERRAGRPTSCALIKEGKLRPLACHRRKQRIRCCRTCRP